MRKVSIYDSTLRDGAQSEGISFSVVDKLKIVEALDNLGVDYIEAGNPSSNIKDLEFFEEVKKIKLKNSKLVAFGSTRKKLIKPQEDISLTSLLNANTNTVCIFGKTHEFHVLNILNTTLEENLLMIKDTILYLKSNNREVFFDAEHFFDGYKSNSSYALNCLKTAQEAGASVIILCDTNGGTLGDELVKIIKEVKKHVSVMIGIHTHNDINMAVANSILAVSLGVDHVQGTYLGIGERTGNANLSSIVPTLMLKMNIETKVDLSLLTETAINIAGICNMNLPNNMPYVGKSAFTHKAGMHIDGVLKSSKSFEHIDPSIVGNSRRFLVSEVAGRGTILRKLLKYGLNLTKDDERVVGLINKIKELEYEGYQFEEAEGSFALLIYKEFGLYKKFFNLDHYKVIGENGLLDSAIIKINVGDKDEIVAAQGEGQVGALDKALRKCIELFYPQVKDIVLIDYKVRILNGNYGTEAITRVLVTSTDGKNTWTTIGVSSDIIEASFIAIVDSIEYKLHNIEEKGE